MQFLQFLLTAIMGATLGLTQNQAPLPGYNVTDLEWNIQVGNDNITLPGPVEKVMAHLDAHYPEYAAQVHQAAANLRADEQSSLSRRTAYSFGQIWCDLGTAHAAIGDIAKGIDYLATVKGTPTNGPGPGNCGQVSCSWNSAIWWCNQNSFTYTIDSYAYIGAGARKLIENCTIGDLDVNGEVALFETHNPSMWWTVVVAGKPDGC